MCARLCLLSLSLHGNRPPLSAAILYIYISRKENGEKRRSHGIQTMYDVPFGLLPLVLERLRSEGRPLVTVLAECGALSVPLGVTFQNALHQFRRGQRPGLHGSVTTNRGVRNVYGMVGRCDYIYRIVRRGNCLAQEGKRLQICVCSNEDIERPNASIKAFESDTQTRKRTMGVAVDVNVQQQAPARSYSDHTTRGCGGHAGRSSYSSAMFYTRAPGMCETRTRGSGHATCGILSSPYQILTDHFFTNVSTPRPIPPEIASGLPQQLALPHRQPGSWWTQRRCS